MIDKSLHPFRDIYDSARSEEISVDTKLANARNALKAIKELIIENDLQVEHQTFKDDGVECNKLICKLKPNTSSANNDENLPDNLAICLSILFKKCEYHTVNQLVSYLNSAHDNLDINCIDNEEPTTNSILINELVRQICVNYQTIKIKKIDEIIEEHQSNLLLLQDSFNLKDLQFFQYKPVIDFNQNLEKYISLLKSYNPHRMLSFGNVILTGWLTAARLSELDQQNSKNVYENCAIAFIDLKSDRLKDDDIFSYSHNKAKVLEALNTINTTGQPAHFIISDDNHWVSVSLLPTDKGLKIYEFDSQNPIGGSYLTGRLTTKLKEFLPKVIGDNDKPLFQIVDVTRLSQNVQYSNNCGFAAGLYVGCLQSIIEDLKLDQKPLPSSASNSFEHVSVNYNTNLMEDQINQIPDLFKKRFSEECLPDNPNNNNCLNAAKKIKDYITQNPTKIFTPDHPLFNYELNRLWALPLIGWKLDLSSQRYNIITQMRLMLKHDTDGHLQYEESRPEINVCLIPFYYLGKFCCTTLINYPTHIMLSGLDILADTLLKIECIFSDSTLKYTKKYFNEEFSKVYGDEINKIYSNDMMALTSL